MKLLNWICLGLAVALILSTASCAKPRPNVYILKIEFEQSYKDRVEEIRELNEERKDSQALPRQTGGFKCQNPFDRSQRQ